MCGIVGIVGNKAENQIEHLNSFITHRGPDDHGTYINTNHQIALGHQRLSILDLSKLGSQPMFSDDGEWVMVFNGEIYNHLDIRQEIEKKYNFKSTSDTETVLYGFIEYGEGIFKRLNGIFALTIYHIKTGDLYIARDHFGIKPLYYYFQENTLLFSSELKAISNYPDIKKDIDYKALVNYLNFSWSPDEQTPLQYFKKLKPGHFIKVNTHDKSTFKIHQYYEIPFKGIYSKKTEEELIDELDEKLYKAVERQLLSDVPVGFFLSGGLDSSAVVAMAKKIRPNERLQCYTINTGDGEEFEGFVNDLHYAKLVAKYLDVDLSIVKADVDIVKDFDKMIYHLDEPQADSAPLNVLNICKQARKEGYVVLLGGTAGDDLFSGYRRHQALNYEKYLKLVPRFIGKGITKILPKLNALNPTIRRIRKLLHDVDKPTKERLANYYRWLPLDTNIGLFSEEIQKKISNYNPSDILINALNNIPDEKEELNWLLYWDLKFFLTDHNLNYTDKLSMAVGVEVRVPFLDLELLEFSTTIPVHLKLKGMTTKYLLKKVMERYLPHEVIYRPKVGFGAPVRDWITNDLDTVISTYLSAEKLKERGIFNPKAVRTLIADNKKGRIDASYSIWCLLAIESWFRQFIDK